MSYCPAQRRAVFRDEASGATETVDTAVLFGADGCASTLRAALQERAGVCVHRDKLDSGYKELTIPAVGSEQGHGPCGRFALHPGALHIWPRGSFMLIALPNRDGSFTCTLFLAMQAAEETPSFAGLRDPARVSEFFVRYFPDVMPLIPNLPEVFMQTPVGCMSTVRTWPWNHGRALLIGDAAHAIVPFFGQGMNAGFEDCTVLERVLDRQPAGAAPDWECVFGELAHERRPDTDAIADLALENYVEMRDKVTDRYFLLKRAVEAEFAERYPGEYRSRYQLVTFTRVPYRLAAAAGRIQNEILDEMCAGLEHAGQVDYARMGSLVAQRLGPLLRENER